MKTFFTTYKTVLFILWSLLSLYVVLTQHYKDIYVLLILNSFPISIISSYIIDIFHQPFVLVIFIGYIGGLVQWVVIIGGLMDKFLPKINFNIKIDFLIKVNNYIFIIGLCGFILSLITIQNGYISAIIYNISLAIVVCSIGVKILFLEKR